MTLLEQGFIIMLIGMGVVFLLLLLLVYSMMLMSKVLQYINTIWPEPIEESIVPQRNAPDDEAIAVAIAAIIHKGYEAHTLRSV